MSTHRNLSLALVLGIVMTLNSTQFLRAQYTPVFVDEYAVSTDTNNLNLETATRQSGTLAPLDYVANTPNVNDSFQHQMFSAATNPSQPLQIAAVGTLTAPPPVYAFAAMVSPNYNFKGSTVDGIIGKRITFDLDVGAMVDETAGQGRYVTTGITIGASIPLVDAENSRELIGEPATSYLSFRFVEDTFATGDPNNVNSNFIQVVDSINTVVVRANHEQGTGVMSVQLDITDPVDGDPWDGVGSTAVDLIVNGNNILSYEKTGGGYTDNIITLWGDRNYAGNGLATHTFDNFTVYAAPAVIPMDDADFDDDGDVDGNDFLTWQRGFGLTGQTDKSTGDSNGDGTVDGIDLANWQTQYGAAPLSSVVAVPEPTSAILIGIIGVCWVNLGRRR